MSGAVFPPLIVVYRQVQPLQIAAGGPVEHHHALLSQFVATATASTLLCVVMTTLVPGQPWFSGCLRLPGVASAPCDGRRSPNVLRVPSAATGGGRYTRNTYPQDGAGHPCETRTLKMGRGTHARCFRYRQLSTRHAGFPGYESHPPSNPDQPKRGVCWAWTECQTVLEPPGTESVICSPAGTGLLRGPLLPTMTAGYSKQREDRGRLVRTLLLSAEVMRGQRPPGRRLGSGRILR